MSKRLLEFALSVALVLGWGTAADGATPMVSAGTKHTLALQSDGTVLAWGSDEFGQLGIGRSLYSAVPLKVVGLNAIRAIGSGPDHVFAIKQDGSVWAWGSNTGGQLGDGTLTDRASPVLVKGLGGVVMAAGGLGSSMALKQDGTVWQWGSTPQGLLFTPTQLAGLSGITSIASYGAFNLALRQDGTVWAWGNNNYGQLGDGTTNFSSLPVQVNGLANVVAVAAGFFAAVALKSDGTVWEWGIGIAGNGSTLKRLVPVQTSGVSGVASVGLGGYWASAVGTDGTVRIWEVGQSPQLLSGAIGISKAAGGGYHTLLFMTDKTVLAYGGYYIPNNTFGQLGDGTTTTRSLPVSVVGLSNMVALAAGDQHSVAIDANGDVWTWGSDAHGQLGRSAVTTQSTPVQVHGLTGVTRLAAGNGHSLAVKQDGTVWAWGNNFAGELGDGSNVNRSLPVAVTGITDVQAIAAGNSHSLALKQDGSLWAWGYNNDGELGNGTSAWASAPVQVTGMTGVSAIAAYFQSLAVKSDGTVWAWGRNEFGQLGLGNFNLDVSNPSKVNATPAQVPGVTNIRSVAASQFASYAVAADGTGWAWGSGQGGELGNGQRGTFPSPVHISNLSQAVEITAGFNQVLARRSDGSVWGWGLSNFGELGDSIALHQATATPAVLNGLKGITQAAAGGFFSMFLHQDGTITAAGDNSSGGLGDGTFARRITPVLVDNTTADGFLNLNVGTITNVPNSLKVPFFVVGSGGIGTNSASVSTTAKINTSEVGKSGAVYVTARVPAGSLGSSTQPLGSGSLSQSPMRRLDVVIPSAHADGNTTSPPILMQLTPTGWQPVTNGQLIPYASGVLGDQLAAQTILSNTDTTNLKGAEFCLGYGTSAAEMGAAGRMRTVATIPDPNATGATGATSIGCLPLPIPQGWSLLGNGLNQSFPVASLYGDITWVNSVWKWDSTQKHWQFYAPLMDAAALQSFTSGKGYGILSEIKPGEGYWVNATAPGSVLFASGSPYTLMSANLAPGWSLAATGITATPSTFNASLSATPPEAGSVPINVISLWAWDNSQAKWYFYAPSLEAQGGTALSDYISSHGYRDFTSANKTFGNGAGFWVNRP